MPEPVPLRLGDAADFERAAAVLREAGFEEESICRRLGLESAWLVEPSSPRQRQLCRRETDRLALLIRLFLLGERVPAAELEPHLEEKSRDSFLSLDLLRAQDGAYWSPVTVSPVEGLLVASDRTCGPAGEPAAPLEDFVFSPNNPGTRNFLQLTPSEPVESFLDLGTGTGVAALAAEAFATRVVGVDIAERSAAFARFNQRLNGRHKTEIRVGDLYGPVEGTQFDRIVTHPPYVPSFSRHAIYRDGGLSGEDILQRVVEGLPRHLRPGGFFVAVCVGLDARQKQFEQRAREWLKAGEGEFDVLFALGDYKTPMSIPATWRGTTGSPRCR